MNNVYQITLKRQLYVFSPAWIKYGLVVLFYLFYFGFTINVYFIYTILGISLIDLVPAIILHIQYFFENRNAILVINKHDSSISYSSRDFQDFYRFNDIDSFKYVYSYGDRKYAPGWYSFGEYCYCRIAFKNNTEIIITRLMMRDIQNTLEMLLNKKADKKRVLLPFIGKKPHK